MRRPLARRRDSTTPWSAPRSPRLSSDRCGWPPDTRGRPNCCRANSAIDPAAIHTLASCDWVRKGLPLCLIGDSGAGKSHLLIALGTEAAMAGFRVKYVLATKLVNELVEAADEKLLTKTFTDPRLCAATVDRLTFGGNIIETGSDSYRLAQTRARQYGTSGN